MKKYAAALGILIGTAVCAPIAIAIGHPAVVGVGSLVGLIIGYVISQSDKRADGTAPTPDRGLEDRLQQLEDLRSKSLISGEEYERKRQEILSDL